MNEYIKTQYEMYKMGGKGIGIEKIKKLAEKFLTETERKELFEELSTEN